MSLEDNPIEEQEEKKPELPNEGRPWLQIMVQADGTIRVHGHIKDKIVAYGLLGSANDAIREFHAKEAKIERVNAAGGLIHNLRNGRFK